MSDRDPGATQVRLYALGPGRPGRGSSCAGRRRRSTAGSAHGALRSDGLVSSAPPAPAAGSSGGGDGCVRPRSRGPAAHPATAGATRVAEAAIHRIIGGRPARGRHNAPGDATCPETEEGCEANVADCSRHWRSRDCGKAVPEPCGCPAPSVTFKSVEEAVEAGALAEQRPHVTRKSLELQGNR